MPGRSRPAVPSQSLASQSLSPPLLPKNTSKQAVRIPPRTLPIRELPLHTTSSPRPVLHSFVPDPPRTRPGPRPRTYRQISPPIARHAPPPNNVLGDHATTHTSPFSALARPFRTPRSSARDASPRETARPCNSTSDYINTQQQHVTHTDHPSRHLHVLIRRRWPPRRALRIRDPPVPHERVQLPVQLPRALLPRLLARCARRHARTPPSAPPRDPSPAAAALPIHPHRITQSSAPPPDLARARGRAPEPTRRTRRPKAPAAAHILEESHARERLLRLRLRPPKALDERRFLHPLHQRRRSARGPHMTPLRHLVLDLHRLTYHPPQRKQKQSTSAFPSPAPFSFPIRTRTARQNDPGRPPVTTHIRDPRRPLDPREPPPSPISNSIPQRVLS